jgi:hypothetical protein
MIFRFTYKLGKKLRFVPFDTLPLHSNPFADWTAHLFTAQRVQYIIITNTASLYSMIMYGRGITDDGVFINRAISYMRDFMSHDDHDFIFERLIVPEAGRVYLSKTLGRGVTGSMNDLVRIAKFEMTERDISPFDVSFQLNMAPMSMLNYGNPREAFESLKVSDIKKRKDTL